jgi:hypothetical protein
MSKLLPVLLMPGLMAGSAALYAQDVVTHIVRVQKERESTRFTLTEWLRIKERMKLMDVWLAMFSKPEEEKFAPELLLGYGLMAGEAGRELPAESKNFDTSATYGTVQFWFTNLVSSTTGLKTLNIDLGLEGNLTNTSLKNTTPLLGETGKWQQTSYGTMNFRIFGRNIQDSALVLKVGKYQTLLEKGLDRQLSGITAGGSMTLYLLNFLGADGTYMKYGGDRNLEDEKREGALADYSVFIEVSALRLGAGRAREQWTIQDDVRGLYKSHHDYRYGYIKLLF